MQRTKHDKGKVEGQKLKIQEILDTLNTPLDETLPADSIPESGTPLSPPLPILYRAPTTLTFSISISQPTNVWSDVRSRCMNFPP